MRKNLLYALGVLLGILICTHAVRGDITFGPGARLAGMGGAGLAVVERAGQITYSNPAALALFSRRFRFGTPSLDFRAHNIPLQKAAEHLSDNPGEDAAVSLARDFGDQPGELGGNIALGLQFGHIEVAGMGAGRALLLPNTAFQTWARDPNASAATLTGAERADLLAAAFYALPAVSIAEHITPPGSAIRVSVGARFKVMRAFFTHYKVDSTVLTQNASATQLQNESKTGLGVDLGFLVHPRSGKGLSFAFVVNDLIEPALAFDGTNANDMPTRYDLHPRSLSFGTAYHAGRMLAALDLVDFTSAFGDPDVRLGVEYRTRGVAVRSGYSSASGFTVGFGYGFLEFAFGSRTPVEIVHTLRF